MNIQDNVVIEQNKKPESVRVDHFVRGTLVSGDEVRHTSRDLGIDFVTPEIDLNELITPRSEMPPLYDLKLVEIIDFLSEVGERFDVEKNPYIQEALNFTDLTNPLPRRIFENQYRRARGILTPDALMGNIKANFSDSRYLDEWVERTDARGQKGALRIFPSRLIHMLAGNSPSVCVLSIAQGAMMKAINVFKMPSSDPFTALVVFRTMMDIDPNHPVVKSMSAVYWRGGDERIEQTVYRPQYFNRIVAWGGGPAIDNVIKYVQPGLQLVSFDPKTSISMIGPEGFASDEIIAQVADSAAADISVLNQEACVASRFVFVEGAQEGIEKFCAKLHERLGVDRESSSAVSALPPKDVREEIEMLKVMGDDTKVWGKFDGRGVVVLTDEPVSFHPIGKVANVVHLKSLDDAVSYVNVATQTIGIYPDETKLRLRDRLANAGVQRVVRLGGGGKQVGGAPHDAMWPLQRFAQWISQEDAD